MDTTKYQKAINTINRVAKQQLIDVQKNYPTVVRAERYDELLQDAAMVLQELVDESNH